MRTHGERRIPCIQQSAEKPKRVDVEAGLAVVELNATAVTGRYEQG